MATAITSSTDTTSVASTEVVQNPNGVLDSDAFMKLLLTELQYQDPTDPMDSGEILTQTSQLATLESADNTNKAIEKLVAQLGSSMDMGALSAIGKMASLGSNAVSLSEAGTAQFEVYFEKEIQSGTLTISDNNGNTVKTVDLAEQAGKNGVLAFAWDGSDDSGNQASPGLYSVKADYTDADGKAQETQFGIYPVESVRYDQGKAQMKLGSSYVDMSLIKEFF